jgi:hypothetical protein
MRDLRVWTAAAWNKTIDDSEAPLSWFYCMYSQTHEQKYSGGVFWRHKEKDFFGSGMERNWTREDCKGVSTSMWNMHTWTLCISCKPQYASHGHPHPECAAIDHATHPNCVQRVPLSHTQVSHTLKSPKPAGANLSSTVQKRRTHQISCKESSEKKDVTYGNSIFAISLDKKGFKYQCRFRVFLIEPYKAVAVLDILYNSS